jgi:phage shock protein PspC (stress-responsive transcriptional regulator)
LLAPFRTQLPSQLQRASRGHLLGGVCAGLAAYPGWVGVGVLRTLFILGGFFAAFPTIPLYLALWFALPKAGAAPTGAPMPKVSWKMRRLLKRIGKQVSVVHAGQDARVAALVQETFDSIKLLAPLLQRPRTVREERLAEFGLLRFPRLLDKLCAMAPEELSDWSDRSRRTPSNLLLDRLVELHDTFNREAMKDIEAAADGTPVGGHDVGSELQSLHELLRPLALRLGQTGAAAAVATLEAIEGKLDFLLGRIEGDQAGMDLRPFKVRRIAFEYLPQTLERYLQLPADLAGAHRIGGGTTAAQSLQEQLELLDSRLGDLTRSYYEKDAAGLLIHGRFLRDKFAESDLRLDEVRRPADPGQEPERSTT